MRKIMIPLTAAALALSPVAAFAQSAAPSATPPATTAPQVAPTTPPTTGATASPFTSAQAGDFVTSNVIGLDVYNSQNEDLGEVKDVVVSNGRLTGYVVSVGGFLGMGERYVLVTPAALKITYSEADKKWKAAMNATKDQLKAAPEFKYEGAWKS